MPDVGDLSVLLFCSNMQCGRYGTPLPYYFNRAELTAMGTAENQSMIKCPSCGKTRKLSPSEKDRLRKLLQE